MTLDLVRRGKQSCCVCQENWFGLPQTSEVQEQPVHWFGASILTKDRSAAPLKFNGDARDKRQHTRTSKPEVPASALLSRRATISSETERTASAAAPSRFSASMELLASACERRRRSASLLSCGVHLMLVSI